MTGHEFCGTPCSTLSLNPSWLATMRKPLAGLMHPAGSTTVELVDVTLFRLGNAIATKAARNTKDTASNIARYLRLSVETHPINPNFRNAEVRL